MQSLLDQNRWCLSFNTAADAVEFSVTFASVFFPGNGPELVKLLSTSDERCGHTCFMRSGGAHMALSDLS